MGTFHLQIDSFDENPDDAISNLIRQDEKAGLLAGHGYGMAKALAALLGCTQASVSGGWIPLPDGTDSLTISIGMQTGKSELAYHERVMRNLLKGPDDELTAVGINSTTGLPDTDHGAGGGRGNAADHPGPVLGVSGTTGTGGADPGTAGGLGARGDATFGPNYPLMNKLAAKRTLMQLQTNYNPEKFNSGAWDHLPDHHCICLPQSPDLECPQHGAPQTLQLLYGPPFGCEELRISS